jgi:hypothetical protein
LGFWWQRWPLTASPGPPDNPPRERCAPTTEEKTCRHLDVQPPALLLKAQEVRCPGN